MSFAKNTPVQYLPGVGWRTAQVMHDLGVHTAGQLNSMPERVLIELFGPSIRSVISSLHLSSPRKNKQSVTRASSINAGSKKKNLASRLRMAATLMTLL